MGHLYEGEWEQTTTCSTIKVILPATYGSRKIAHIHYVIDAILLSS